MNELAPIGKLDRELLGEPVPVGTRTLQPVARLTGWSGGQHSGRAGGAGAWLQLQPVEVIVREEDGREYHVPVVDKTQMAIKGIWQGALVFAALCWLITVVIRLVARRRAR